MSKSGVFALFGSKDALYAADGTRARADLIIDTTPTRG